MYREMCVLYAFMRHTDDLSDQDELPVETRRQALAHWKNELVQTLDGTQTDNPILLAVADLAKRRNIPREPLIEVIHGVQGDLTPRVFTTFTELEHYCYQVAGVVGLCCLKIWGYRGEDSLPAAIACGTAFQMTNILRDLSEDAARHRVYLPECELSRFECSASDLHQGVLTPQLRKLMEFQVHRAWEFYREASLLQDRLSGPGRRIFLAFFELYSTLLRKIEAADYDVLSQRIRLSKWQKGWIALRCLLRLECRSHVPVQASAVTEKSFVPDQAGS